MTDAVTVDAVRTPIGKGKFHGALAGMHPVDLHAHAIRSLVERTGIDPAHLRRDQRRGRSGRRAKHEHRPLGRTRRRPAGVGSRGHRGPAMRQQPASSPLRRTGRRRRSIIASGVESMSRVPMGSQATGHDPYGPLPGWPRSAGHQRRTHRRRMGPDPVAAGHLLGGKPRAGGKGLDRRQVRPRGLPVQSSRTLWCAARGRHRRIHSARHHHEDPHRSEARLPYRRLGTAVPAAWLASLRRQLVADHQLRDREGT